MPPLRLKHSATHPHPRMGENVFRADHLIGYRFATQGSDAGPVVLEVFLSAANGWVARTFDASDENVAELERALGPRTEDVDHGPEIDYFVREGKKLERKIARRTRKPKRAVKKGRR